jgi:branched-chain amino acid transport system permease protein
MWHYDLSSIITILITGICVGGIFGLLSISFTIQFGVLNIPDFSFGTWIVFSMYLTYFIIKIWNLGALTLVVLPLYIVIGFLLSNYLFSGKPLFSQVTIGLGISFIIQNFILVIFGAYIISLGITDKTIIFLNGIQVGIIKLSLLFISAGLFLGLQLFIKKTWPGKVLRAVVQQREVANILGVNGKRVINIAFGLCFLLTAVSGIMLLLVYSIDPFFSAFYMMMSFMICVTAGLGNLKGAFFTGIIVGAILSILDAIIPQFSMVVFFVIFSIIIIFKPKGLFSPS